MGRKWNKMSETLKQKFNKSKPEAAEPDTKPTDIQPEKEPVDKVQPNIEPQVKSDTEEESRLSKPEVPTAGPEITPESSELSDLSDLIGRSNVGSTIKLPSDEAAKNDIKLSEEVSEEPVAEEIITDDVIPEHTAEETEVEEAAPDEAVVEQDAVEENADQEAVAEDASVEETVSAEEAVVEEDVAEKVIINAQEGITAEQPASDENEATIESAEEATEEAAEETTEAIIDLNEVKSDGNQQIKSELQDQIDIAETEAAEVAVDSAQGEGIPATD